MLASIAWIVPVKCCWAALALFVSSYQLRKLLYTRATLKTISANGWGNFEKKLVNEAFRRQGYTVKENSPRGGRPTAVST